jgi:hypothetical protein
VRGLDAEDVRPGYRVTALLDRFGVEYRDRPQIRLSTCPLCGKHQRRPAFLIDRETGDCIHHSGPDASGAQCKSDIFGLTAALAGLDVRTEFSRVVELAAEIAGVTRDHDPAGLARRRAEYRARVEASARQEATERAAAEASGSPARGLSDRVSVSGSPERTCRSTALRRAAIIVTHPLRHVRRAG